MKSFIALLLTSIAAMAVDVPLVTTGATVRVVGATFTAVRISSVTIEREGAALQATTSIVPVSSQVLGVARSVALTDAQLATAIPDYAAQRAAVLGLLPTGLRSITATVDATGQITAHVPTLTAGAWRLVPRDEAWLLAHGVDCSKIRAGVLLLVGKLK